MKNKKRFYFLLGIIFLLLVWFVLSLVYKGSIVIPSIIDTIKRLGYILLRGHTYVVLGSTILRLIMSVGISFIFGLGLSFLSYKSYRVKEFLKPLLSVTRCIPVVSVIIIILMIFKVSFTSIVVASLVIFPIIYTTMLEGMESIPGDLLDDARTLDNINLKMLFKLLIPLMKEYLLIALLSSTGLGLKVLVMSEFIAAPKYSIAREMASYQASFDMASIFGWTLLMLLFIFIFEYLIKLIKGADEEEIKGKHRKHHEE